MSDQPTSPKASAQHTPMSKRVGKFMWRADGEPERVAGDPTSAYPGWYEDRAAEVLFALSALGYKVSKPRRKATEHAA